jgi:hypothetical protein
MPGVCDRRDRVAARVYLALRTDCGCCTFWRGVVLGGVTAGVTALILGTVVFIVLNI